MAQKMNKIIRILWHAKKKQGKLFMWGPVLMSHGSCTDNCSQTADNSRCLFMIQKNKWK
jgi:hypothetical protein